MAARGPTQLTKTAQCLSMRGMTKRARTRNWSHQSGADSLSSSLKLGVAGERASQLAICCLTTGRVTGFSLSRVP